MTRPEKLLMDLRRDVPSGPWLVASFRSGRPAGQREFLAGQDAELLDWVRSQVASGHDVTSCSGYWYTVGELAAHVGASVEDTEDYVHTMLALGIYMASSDGRRFRHGGIHPGPSPRSEWRSLKDFLTLARAKGTTEREAIENLRRLVKSGDIEARWDARRQVVLRVAV